MPDDDMGHHENITNETWDRVAGEMGMEPSALKLKVMHDLETQESDSSALLDPAVNDMFNKASEAWGQPIEEAKKNTLSLLRKTLKH